MAKKNKLPVSDIPTISRLSPEDKERERRYRTEDALRTLEQADKYRGDKELMRDVKKMAKEKMKTLNKIC